MQARFHAFFKDLPCGEVIAELTVPCFLPLHRWWLVKPGDRLDVDIAEIGRLTNVVR
jgi:hypothetical protein